MSEQEDIQLQESQKELPSSLAPDGVLPLILSLLGLFLFQPLCIVSLVMSNKDRKISQEMGVDPDGKIKAAWIISVIGIVLMALGLILLVSVILLSAGVTEGISSQSS